jgi:hypothetical protein
VKSADVKKCFFFLYSLRLAMKKTFKLSHPKIKPARLVDSIKHEVKKYIKRERNKKLPENADFWDFDCKYGKTEEEAQDIHLTEINKCIDGAVSQELESFYLEMIVKEGSRQYKANLDDIDDGTDVDEENDIVGEADEEL